jgi:glycosyltransferase involved in cell wall biosynthesis
MQKPEITVLMPAYNAADFIAEAIQSVLQQSFTPFELLVIDDGSTDTTAAIVSSFNDRRIRLHQQPNRGVAAALNAGLALAHAPLIARFDADDLCFPNRLSTQREAMNTDHELVILGSAVEYIDIEKNPVFTWNPPAVSHHELLAMVHENCPFIHSSVMFRKEAVLKAGGYPEHAHSFEDHLLWTKLLPLGKGANLKEALMQVRLNAQSITIDERWRPAAFRKIKSEALRTGCISTEYGNRLLDMLQRQNLGPIKEGAYHALLGKKYLWNNFQPRKARQSLLRALACNPFYTAGYGLLAASYLPPSWIRKGYKAFKNHSPHE